MVFPQHLRLLCTMRCGSLDGTITMMTTAKDLKAWIKKCEKFESHPYIDSAGKLTIGYGRNLQDNGITPAEADFLFENDFADVVRELSSCTWYSEQPVGVRAALVNMAFNLGVPRLKLFKRMIAALVVKNYAVAALEALNSKWAKQVGDRAKDVAMLIREGK